MNKKSEDHMELERLLYFSDAVFAIAITLLALELKVPAHEAALNELEFRRALLAMLPTVIGFISSFILIGQTWIEHHRIGKLLMGVNRGILWRNLSLLFFVAIMPFTTALVSEYFASPTAISVYAVCFSCLGLCKVGLWRYAQSSGLIKGDQREVREVSRRIWASPIVSLGVLVLAMVGIPYVYFGFLLIPLIASLLSRSS
jgi:uncharacterized membrane protein